MTEEGVENALKEIAPNEEDSFIVYLHRNPAPFECWSGYAEDGTLHAFRQEGAILFDVKAVAAISCS